MRYCFLGGLACVATLLTGAQSTEGERGAHADLSRTERVRLAEQAARELFEEDHYYFLTRHGRVDPAEGGIPAFALGERSWSAFRGKVHIKEKRLLRATGRHEDAKKASRRRAVWGAVTLAGATSAFLSAWQLVEFDDGFTSLDALGTVGFLGGFTVAEQGRRQYASNRFSVDELFYDVQELNDSIQESIRAQVRLEYDVPPLRASPED